MRDHNPLAWLTDRATGKVGRWVTLALWLATAGVLSATAPKLANLYDNKATTSIGNPESVQAQNLLNHAFPKNTGIPAIIVLSDPAGLTSADQTAANQIACWLLSDQQRAATHACAGFTYPQARPIGIGPVVALASLPQARRQLVAADGTTETIIAALNISSSDSLSIQKAIQQMRAYTDTFAGPTLQVRVTGPAGILADLVDIFASTDIKLLLTTVLLVLVLLLLIYRSPLLAALPLVGVGWALAIINGLLGYVAQARLFPVGQQSTAIMEVLLFGAGTDYTIFIVARLREELQATADFATALRATMHGVGEAITSSAGTVILGLLTLVLATLGLYSALGLVLALAVAVMLLAGLTLVPALLSLVGRAAFWPFIPHVQSAEALARAEARQGRGFWGRIAGFVTGHPIVAVAGSLVLLGALALGNIGIGADFNSLSDLRDATPATEGYQLLAQHFAPGTLAPLDVVIHLRDGGNAYQQLVAIDQIDQAVANDAQVAQVTGPTRPDGQPPAIAPAVLQQDFAHLPDALKQAIRAGQVSATGGTAGPPGSSINPQVIGLYAATVAAISNDNATVILTVTLNTDPYSAAALDAMAPLRATAIQAATQAGLGPTTATVQLAGVTPQLADTRAANQRDTYLIVPLVLVLVGIILALLLRSLVAPLYLLGAVTLNFFAALGASSLVFTHLQGEIGISYATPLYTFIFLVALGADYTIFLMARVREEAARRGLADGTRVALSRTGGVITSAGLILAGTFLVLTTLPLRTLSDFGFAVALGVLLDTFVVRGLLVPEIVVLLGRANWWPGKLTPSAGDQAIQTGDHL